MRLISVDFLSEPQVFERDFMDKRSWKIVIRIGQLWMVRDAISLDEYTKTLSRLQVDEVHIIG
jgi:hypothetical protein